MICSSWSLRCKPNRMMMSTQSWGGKGFPRATLIQGVSSPRVQHGNLLRMYSNRALKRTKAFTALTDTRPTIRNKPSGLVNSWPRLLADASPTVYHRSPTLTMSPASSSTPAHSLVPSPSPSSWRPHVYIDMPSPDTYSHSFQAVSAPNMVCETTPSTFHDF